MYKSFNMKTINDGDVKSKSPMSEQTVSFAL